MTRTPDMNVARPALATLGPAVTATVPVDTKKGHSMATIHVLPTSTPDVPEGVREFCAAVEPNLRDWGFTDDEIAALGYPFPVTLQRSTEITCDAIRKASRP